METDYEQLYRQLIEKMMGYGTGEAALAGVTAAYEMAERAHNTQFRQSGEPYIIHPLHVALILADLQLDAETVEAALLHDVAEDTAVTLDDIREAFGGDVADLVDGVTKLKQLTYTANEKEELQAENYRKLFIAMARDVRVILIKLADRLHNMRTLEYKSPEKQKVKARETLDIYSPIANRLGISAIKVELDDLSLKYLEPEAYFDLVEKVAERLEERQETITATVDDVKQALAEAGITATVTGRRKHYFSIYKKMVTKQKSIDQIYDIIAIRAIVDSVKDCYGSLGIIHEMYTPMPGRFKDYIAMPKVNGYQSLHTTVIGRGGEPFEVQIRTWDMHRTAEYGVAAHWLYKEQGSVPAGKEEKMKWLQKILEWQEDVADGKEFVDALKQDLDLFKDSVYCFSPKGEVISLPAGSTPIDFAYMIHSAVGNKMVGARVNDRIVTLDYQLGNGDRVEIMTSQNSKGPSRDWIKIAQTSQARTKINQWFKKEFKQENIQRGRELIEKYLKAKNMPSYGELAQPEWMQSVERKYGFLDWDSLLATIGHGSLKEGQVANRLYEEWQKVHPVELTDEELLEELNKKKETQKEREGRGGSPIVVKGIHDVAVHFSRCCSPLPGDEIVGYVTRGRGVSIHRTDCVNVLNMPLEERKRLIEAEWEEDSAPAGSKFLAAVQIEAKDQPGMLASISACISNMGISIDTLSARRTKDKTGSIFNLSVEISDKAQLEQMIVKLEQLSGVHEIIRTTV